MRSTLAALMCLFVFSAIPAKAQTDCSGGIINDDGVFEDGLRFNAADGRMVQKIVLPSPQSLRSVCVCWQSLSSGDSAVNFNLLVYDATGVGGQPGTLIASVPETALGIPSGLTGKFYKYDLSGVNLSSDAYIGVQVNGFTEPGIYLCESTGLAPAKPGYASITGGAVWTDVVLLDPLFEAFGLRALTGPSTQSCFQTATDLCLNNGRFKVSAT